MAQDRQRGQAQSSIPQPTRQSRLTGRLSPQQSLKRVGPAISEVLRTSVRPKPRNGVPITSKRQKFRPNSGADAVLCLEGRVDADHDDDVREPVSRGQQTEIAGSRRLLIPATGLAPPSASQTYGRHPLSGCAALPEKRASIVPPPVKKDGVKVHLPGLLINRQPNNIKGRRMSKALPSLPPPTPSPCRASFNSPSNPSKDVFQNNRDKVLQGQGAPVVPVAAPPMHDASGSSEYSSGSSYDSAEQTWNMINNMMRAVGEDEVKKARETLIHPIGVQRSAPLGHASGAYVTFPRMRREGQGRDGWSSDCTMSERTARTPSTDSSSTYCSTGLLNEYLQSQEPPWAKDASPQQPNKALSLKRRASVASSVFSIVIQPMREPSRELQDALVAEDDLPSRIRGILQCTHGKYDYDPRMCSRTSTTPGGVELHPDVALTIDALRAVSVEDISFA